MSKILVDELVNLVGTDKVTFSEGLKISNGETIDLNGATITLDTGIGLNDQLLASTGSGLKWVTFSDTNSTYAFASVNAAVNDVKLNLTGGGDAAGQLNQVTMTGSGSVSLTENAGVITVTGTDTNTTYDLIFADETDGASATLTGSDTSADALILKGGSNIDVTRSNNIITFSTTLSGTVGAPSTTTDNAVALFDGTNGTLLKNSTLVYDSSGNLSGVNSLDTATQTASKIPFWYDQISSFPSATQYEGSFAFSNANNTMHFAAGNSWYQVARIDDLTLDTDTTYSIALTGTSTASLVLSDSNAVTDTVTFRRNTYGTIELERDGDNLYFDDRIYSVSAVTGPGSGAYLRLTGQNHDKDGNVTTTVTDDITLLGANGLVISRTDANTITFTQGGGSGGGGSYTDGDAKDAAATALLNGTSLGITFTYDSVNKVINTQVGTTPTTFNFTTAAETGNYLVTGSDRGNTYNGDADPTITVYEGDTIVFDNTATRVSHPMYIRVASEGASVSNPAASGEGTATVSWTPTTAGTYYYQCGSHPLMIGTITVLSAGGGGGGSAILYDLYGTNTTSNNVILNLDPSVGNTDQIEFTGADATTLSWDASNNRVTISSPAQVQPDWDATSGLGQILNKPTIPTAYTLPAATTTTLGGMIAGTGINIQPSGEIETSLQIITDANNSTTNDLSAAGLTLNTNYTSVAGTTGDIKRIGDLPYYYDGTDWRLFYLTGQPTSAAQTDVNFDDVQVRLTGTTNGHSSGSIYNHANGGYFASAGTAGSVTSPVKYGSYALEFEGTNSSYIRTTNSHPANPLPIVQASDNTYSTTAKRGGFPDFSGSWTFEAWVRFDDLGGATADRWGIMCRTKVNGTGAGLGVGLSLIKNSGSMQWLLGWYNGTGLTTDNAVPFQAFHDYGAFDWQEDTWYHISVSRRASDGRLFCHLNGNFVAPSAAANGEYFDTDLNQSVTTAGEYEFRLGNNRSNMASFASAQNQREHYLLGAIDDVRWTDYQRYDNTNFTPPTEAYPITAPVPPTVDPDWDDVVLRFPFDTSLNDVSSNELTGTASNAVYVYRASTPLKYGTNVLRFDGVNHYLEVSDPNYILRFGGTWTAEFWYNADSLPATTAYRNCIWSTTSSLQNTQDVGFGIEAYDYNTNKYRFYWRNGTTATEMHYDDFTREDFIGKWNHVAITRDSQGDFKVYLNGYRLRYNANDDDFFNDSNISALISTDNEFRFGHPADDVNNDEYGIDGYIDDFRLTSTVKYTDNFTPPSGPLPATGTVTSDPGTTTSSVTGLASRDELTGSVTLDANETGDLNITGYKAYSLLKIETDADAWVRVYTDAAARTADATRSEFADPSPGDGVIAETRGSGEIQLSPPPYGYNNDSPNVGDTIYTAVTNRSGSNATINVTLTAIRLEA
jgi:plastocyanin